MLIARRYVLFWNNVFVAFSFHKLTSLVVLCFIFYLFTAPVVAQDLPDAGSILREVEPIQKPVLPSRSEDNLLPDKPVKTSSSTMTMEVLKYQFEGNSVVTTMELTKLSESFLQRPIGVNDLNLLTRLVAKYYREQGYLARVVLPKQAIENGVIRIKVIESKFAGIEVKNISDSENLRIKQDIINKIFTARQSKSENLFLLNIERSLLIANDWPGLNVTGSLKAGEADGESALLVLADNTPLTSVRAKIDNYGSRNTGTNRFTGTFTANAPLGYGEQFKVHWLASRGTKYVHVATSFPIAYDGLRLGFDASYLDYRVVNDAYADLDLKGSSSLIASSLTYPIIRKNTYNLMLTTRVEQKRFTNKARGFFTKKSTTEDISFGLQANYFDDLGLGGATSTGFNFILGRVDKNSANLFDPTAGGFSAWRYWFERHQFLSEKFSASISFNGQRASKLLDSSEQFSVGGASSLRAYPVNEGRGSEGDLLNMKLKWSPTPRCHCTISALFDIGRVKELDTSFVNNSYHYKSIGVESTLAISNGWFATATVARRLGNNPQITSVGTDQDGSFKENRIWFSIEKSF